MLGESHAWKLEIIFNKKLFQVQKNVQYKYLYECVAEYLKSKSSEPLYQNEVNEVVFDENYIYEDDDGL